MTNVHALPAQSYVYVIGDPSGPQKIGLAADPKSRLRALRCDNAGDLQIAFAAAIPRPLVREAERYAHWLLRHLHARGEWFSVSPERASEAVVEAVAAVLEGKRAPHLDFGGPGRPPKQRGRFVVSRSIWVYPDAVARALAFVGPSKVSEYLRDAIDEKLDRDGAPPFDAVTMPLKQPRSKARPHPPQRQD